MIRRFAGVVLACVVAFLCFGLDGVAGPGITKSHVAIAFVPSAHAQGCEYPPEDEPDNDGDECNPNYPNQIQKAKSEGASNPDCPTNCPVPQKVGDPINFTIGSFYEEFTDYTGGGPFPIIFKRFFNSQDATGIHEFGRKWHSSFSRRITANPPANGVNTISVLRDDGRVFTFTGAIPQEGIAFTSISFTGDADVNGRLTLKPQGWVYTTAEDEIETYDTSGRLLSIANRAGLKQAMAYNPSGQLMSVTDPFGRTLRLSYGSNSSQLIAGITPPDGTHFAYGYDSTSRLTSVTAPDGGIRQLLYENTTYANMLTGMIDENGSRFLTVSYDANGFAISSQHAGGAELYQVDYTYYNLGVVKATNPVGAQTSYLIAGLNGTARVAQTNWTCSSCNYSSGQDGTSFDTNGNLLTYLDYNNHTTTYTYDSRNLQTSVTLPGGEITNTTWHATFHLPSQIAETGRTTNFTYDAHGNLLSKSVASTGAARTWSATYNAFGEPLTASDPDSNVTKFGYDGSGDLTSITNALGQVTQITSYDANGRPLNIVDPNGVTTTLIYNFRGQVLSRTIGSRVTSFAYDKTGQLTTLTSPDGSMRTFAYDAAHRLTGVTDSLGNRIAYTLDAMGNVTQEDVFDSSSNKVRTHGFVYDGFGRLISDNYGLSAETTHYYRDRVGNVTQLRRPTGNDVQNSYDADDRLTQAYNGSYTNFSYDALSRLSTVSDSRSLITTYGYNILDEQNKLVSPDTGTSTKAYDPAGNLASSTDANGKVLTYSYDALNRLTRMATSAGGAITYSYDQGTNGIGHLTGMTDGSGTTTWGYNKYGEVNFKQLVSGSISLATRYAYTAATGLLASISYPSGAATSYSYNANGQIAAIAWTAPGSTTSHPLLSSVKWQPFGPVASWTMGNGAAYVRSYYLEGWLAGITMPGSASIAYNYDYSGEITKVTETGQPTKTYAYDLIHQLQSYNFGTGSQTYATTYSYNRNALTVTNGNATATLNYAYDSASNHLLGISGDHAESFTYDAAGNTTQRITPTVTINFAYNARNRLNQVTVNGAVMNYVLNGLGQRALKTPAGGSPTYFVYGEDGQIMGRYNGTVGYEETIYLDGMPVALLQPAGAYYIAPDNLGAPHQITDGGGNVVWRWDHDPFGNGTPTGALTTYHGRFPGQYFDGEAGLNYNYYRDYDPTTGRYIESDPIGLEGGVNTFAYVGTNTTNLVDVYGLCADNNQQPAKNARCTAARAAIAGIGSQLSIYGNQLTYSGIGLVGVSGIGAIFAPEAFPAELGGAEAGAALIETGGAVTTLGATLTGYGRSGAKGGLRAAVISTAVDQISSRVTGGLFPGIDSASKAATSALLGEIPDAFKNEEAACEGM